MTKRAWLAAVVAIAIPGLFATRVAAQDAELVIRGARIYPSPGATPIDGGAIVVRDGKIAEVRADSSGELPSAGRVIEATGLVVTAGFWNCHVHFTEPKWAGADELPESALGEQLRAMLTRHGFTSVVDTGSVYANTAALKQRIARGVPGPRILAASGSFVPENGSPAYLEVKLPEVKEAGSAERLTREVLGQGADAIKIFTGSFLGPGRVAHLLLPVVQAVTAEAHRQGKLVVAHPQTLQGVELALDGGVDILAHTAPQGGNWSEPLVARLVQKGMGLIPTLKLWRFELTRMGVPAAGVDRAQAMGVGQLRSFAAAGGEVLFGTDVGYMTDYDPTEEYQRMAEAGLTFDQILAALTTNPVRRFDDPAQRGTVELGKHADLVILAADPHDDSAGFAEVRYTIRAGQVIYDSSE
jgi:imidazolonepropionase-like amidohydrolase